MLRASVEEVDRVLQDGRDELPGAEARAAFAPGEREDDARADRAGDGAREDRPGTDVVPGEAATSPNQYNMKSSLFF